MKSKYQIKILKSLSPEFISQWTGLWESSSWANPYNSVNWFLSVIKTFGYREYLIIAAYRDAKLEAVAALIKENKYGIKFYSLPPGDYVCGWPVLVNPENSDLVGLIIEQLLSVGNVLFNNIPETIAVSLKQGFKQTEIIPCTLNYYLNIEKDSGGRVIISNRKKLTYRIKNIDDKFRLESYTGNSKAAIKTVFKIDSQSRKQARGYGTFTDPNIKKLYQALAANFGPGFLILILYFENKPIAYRMGFIFHRTFFASQIAYLSKYNAYSPGNVLLVKFIDKFGSLDMDTLDFGSGDSSFKRSFTPTYKNLYTVIISGNFLTRKYISLVYLARSFLFGQLRKNVSVYKTYRVIKSYVQN
jgi:CelD/BcsL family acetyltransferase involved in cellulose biosynthesis